MVELTNDFRYDILEYLHTNGKEVDVAPFIHKRREITGQNRQHFETILSRLRQDNMIYVGLNELGKLSHSSRGIFNDTKIMMEISPLGIDEYLRLKKLKIDIRNAEFIYKTYPYTVGTAILGVILGIITLLMKILEHPASK